MPTLSQILAESKMTTRLGSEQKGKAPSRRISPHVYDKNRGDLLLHLLRDTLTGADNKCFEVDFSWEGDSRMAHIRDRHRLISMHEKSNLQPIVAPREKQQTTITLPGKGYNAQALYQVPQHVVQQMKCSCVVP